MRSRFVLAAVALGATLAVAGCKDSPTQPPAGGGSGTTHTVTIQNFAFSPATLTIAAGDKVVWTNRDTSPHTATSDTGNGINTGSLSKDQSSTAVTFSGAGTFTYHCAFHSGMTATIVVK